MDQKLELYHVRSYTREICIRWTHWDPFLRTGTCHNLVQYYSVEKFLFDGSLIAASHVTASTTSDRFFLGDLGTGAESREHVANDSGWENRSKIVNQICLFIRSTLENIYSL